MQVVLLLILVANVCADLITVNNATYTFTFTQSISGFTIWTAPATRRIRNTDTTAPSAMGSTLPISCAMEEVESFQVIIGPTTTFTQMTVSYTNFTGMGTGKWVDVGHAQFSPVSPWAQGTKDQTLYRLKNEQKIFMTQNKVLSHENLLFILQPICSCNVENYNSFELTFVQDRIL